MTKKDAVKLLKEIRDDTRESYHNLVARRRVREQDRREVLNWLECKIAAINMAIEELR